MKELSHDDCVLVIQTVQSGVIKTLCDVLKETLNDINFIFTETGLKLMAMDGAHVALIHLRLMADRFETYVCRERLQVGDDGRARQEGEAAWLVWVEEELARVAVDMDALKELAQSAERAKGEAEAGILEAQERNAQLATQVKRALHVPEKCSV